MRIGHGYDVHRLVEGRPCIIGGVNIPCDLGLLGHSDADVLAHAIADALLGAARLGDIGKLFPDTDPQYEGADSMVLLSQVADLLYKEGFEIVDIDSTIAAQVPKISPYREQMRQTIASALGIETNQVGVKATTTEGLGFPGRKEGIEAWSVVLIRESNSSRCCK